MKKPLPANLSTYFPGPKAKSLATKTTPAAPPEFDTFQVRELAQISFRQVQWWDEQGIVRSDMRGHKRFYSLENTVLLMVMGELRRRGYGMKKLRQLKRALLEAIRRPLYAYRAFHTAAEFDDTWLVTDARRVAVVSDLVELDREFHTAARVTLLNLTAQFQKLEL